MKRLLARFWHQAGLIYRFIGIVSGQKAAFLNAERAMSRALRLHPGYTLARYNRALLYWRELSATQQAIEELTLLVDHPDYKDIYFIRAMAYQDQGDYWSAITDLEAYLVRYPHGRSSNNAISQLNALYAIVDDMPPSLHTGRSSGE